MPSTTPMSTTWTFITHFFGMASLLWPLLMFFILLISSLGLWIGRMEGWSCWDALYFAFVTATTVGYGDFRPRRQLSKLLAILAAIIGMVATGLVVAIGLRAAEFSIVQHLGANARPEQSQH